jgi:hypothetical protein
MFAGCVVLARSLFTSTPDPLRAAIGLAMLAGPILLFWWLRHRELQRAAEGLAAINPVKLRFTAQGIETIEKSGASSFVPWSGFSGFREGRTVILTARSRSVTISDNPVRLYEPDDVVRGTIRYSYATG